MGQYKLWIGFSWTDMLLGMRYDKGFEVVFHFGFIHFGIGLTDGANGFAFQFNE